MTTFRRFIINSASLQIVGNEKPLLLSETNRNMTYLNSVSTPKDGLKAVVVWIKSVDEIESVSVKGKVVFAEMNVRKFYKSAIKNGALGILTMIIPHIYNQKSTLLLYNLEVFLLKMIAIFGALHYPTKQKRN